MRCCSRFTAILILLGTAGISLDPAGATDLKNYLFDMGAANSKVAPGYTLVTPDDTYTPERGYGFTAGASGAFRAERSSRFKRSLIDDGVSGRSGRREYARESLAFRVDLPPGRYITEVGLPDGPGERSLQVYVNGTFMARTQDSPLRRRDAAPPALLRFPVIISGDTAVVRVEGAGHGSELYRGQRIGLTAVSFQPAWTHRFRRQDGRLELVEPGPKLTPDQQRGIDRYNRGDLEGAAAVFRKPEGNPEIRAELLLWTAGHIACPDHRDRVIEALELLERLPPDLRNANRVEGIRIYLNGLDLVEARGWSWARERYGTGLRGRSWLAEEELRRAAGDRSGPLHYQALYALGRLYFGNFMESGYARYVTASDALFLEIRRAFPKNRLIRMYLGERFPYDRPEYTAGADGAPLWAAKQREALKRMLDVIHYWTDERQAENGEMGGDFEDDCEMLRHWQPAVFAADDARARAAIRRMADGIWNSDLIENGYSRRAYDVEHSSELISDTHPILLAADYGNPEYVERAMATARVMRDVWTGRTERGNLHFRSMYIGARDVDPRPPRNVDLPYNGRAVKPVRWLAWYNRHPEAVRLISEWGRAWMDAIEREADGKPAGVVPAAVTFPENGLAGRGENWYDTGLGRLYSFPSAAGMIYDHLLAVWWITGDEAFLKPHRDGLKILENPDDLPGDAEIGTRAWALRKVLSPGRFSSYRLLTGDTRFDALFREHGSNYLRWRMTGDTSHLVAGCERSIESTRINRPFLTSEVYFTDRVFVEGAEHLLAMYTGDVTGAGDFPSFAVTWTGTGPDFAALVTESTDDRLDVQAYSFEAEDKAVGMRLWRLHPGAYTVTVTPEGRAATRREDVEVRRGSEVEIPLPSRRLTQIALERTGEAGSEPDRLPDPGISPRDIAIGTDGVRVTVHNIGAAPVKGLTIALLDGEREIDRTQIQSLEAPLDLLPRTAEVILSIPPGGLDSITVVLDPEGKLDEITRANNRVTVPAR